MSSTNKTSHYNLPIYQPNDKPTYLGDWNETMTDIDVAINTAKNIADAANQLASNTSTTVVENTTDIAELQSDVALIKTNQTAINAHLTDNDNSIATLNEHSVKVDGQLMSGAIPFQFAVDSDGNYGYKKVGADTVYPFNSGTIDLSKCKIVELKSGNMTSVVISSATPNTASEYTANEHMWVVVTSGTANNSTRVYVNNEEKKACTNATAWSSIVELNVNDVLAICATDNDTVHSNVTYRYFGVEIAE